MMCHETNETDAYAGLCVCSDTASRAELDLTKGFPLKAKRIMFHWLFWPSTFGKVSRHEGVSSYSASTDSHVSQQDNRGECNPTLRYSMSTSPVFLNTSPFITSSSSSRRS